MTPKYSQYDHFTYASIYSTSTCVIKTQVIQQGPSTSVTKTKMFVLILLFPNFSMFFP